MTPRLQSPTGISTFAAALPRLTESQQLIVIGVLNRRYADKDHAAWLGKSPKTIAVQKTEIYRRLGVHSMRELIARLSEVRHDAGFQRFWDEKRRWQRFGEELEIGAQ